MNCIISKTLKVMLYFYWKNCFQTLKNLYFFFWKRKKGEISRNLSVWFYFLREEQAANYYKSESVLG